MVETHVGKLLTLDELRATMPEAAAGWELMVETLGAEGLLADDYDLAQHGFRVIVRGPAGCEVVESYSSRNGIDWPRGPVWSDGRWQPS